jgi:hypothetical protein
MIGQCCSGQWTLVTGHSVFPQEDLLVHTHVNGKKIADGSNDAYSHARPYSVSHQYLFMADTIFEQLKYQLDQK